MNITQTTAKTAQFRALLELPVTDLIELVNQAYETGAINYWVDDVKESHRAPEGKFDHNYCYQFTFITDGKEFTINVDTIRDGIQAILNGLQDTTYVKGYILRAVVEQDLGYIDSDALDQIVQAGVFGSIVYG